MYEANKTMRKQHINFEGIARELEAINSSQQDPRMVQNARILIELFQQMGLLVEEMRNVKTSEELDTIREKIGQCQNEVNGHVERFCKDQGFTVDEAREYVTNPQNFDQRRWEDIQTMQRRLEEASIERETLPSIVSLAANSPRINKKRNK